MTATTTPPSRLSLSAPLVSIQSRLLLAMMATTKRWLALAPPRQQQRNSVCQHARAHRTDRPASVDRPRLTSTAECSVHANSRLRRIVATTAMRMFSAPYLHVDGYAMVVRCMHGCANTLITGSLCEDFNATNSTHHISHITHPRPRRIKRSHT